MAEKGRRSSMWTKYLNKLATENMYLICNMIHNPELPAMCIFGLLHSKKWMGGQIIYICISESRGV